MPPLRERAPLLRLAVEPVLREDFAAPVERFGVDFFAVLRALDDRLAPVLDDLALVDVFRAPDVLRFAVERLAVERPDEARALLLRPPPLREDPVAEPEVEPELALAPPSIVHLPDMTR